MKNLINMFFISIFYFLALDIFAFPSDSLYQFEHKWISKEGTVVEFKNLSDEKYKVVTLIYTSCPAACPLIIGDLKLLDSKLTKEQASNVEYLIFSIDPTDTPATLTKFYEKFKLDPRWKLFRGEEGVIKELAAAVGYKYKKNDDGSYSHSTNVALLNSDGQIVKGVEFSNEAKNLSEFIKVKKK